MESALTQMQEWGKGKLVHNFVIEIINPDAGTRKLVRMKRLKPN